MRLLKRLRCYIGEHDWRSGPMFSDGWTDTCERCGKTREFDR